VEPTRYTNTVRIGYARVSGRTQDHQLQLDALAAADCREVIVETASTRGERPKLRATLADLKAGDTLVVYKPDRIARSMKELLVLLEDDLHARNVNLHILTGICAGLHRPNSASVGDKMLFMVAAMAAEMERDLIRERTLDGLRAAQAQGRRGGRPPTVTEDALAAALARLLAAPPFIGRWDHTWADQDSSMHEPMARRSASALHSSARLSMPRSRWVSISSSNRP
jgi:DNA invertase Pin-like site-specific DNA recombinase